MLISHRDGMFSVLSIWKGRGEALVLVSLGEEGVVFQTSNHHTLMVLY